MLELAEVGDFGEDPYYLIPHVHTENSNRYEDIAGNENSAGNHVHDLLETAIYLDFNSVQLLSEHHFVNGEESYLDIAQRAEDGEEVELSEINEYAVVVFDGQNEHVMLNGVEASTNLSGNDPSTGHALVYGLPLDADHRNYQNISPRELIEQAEADGASVAGAAHPGMRWEKQRDVTDMIETVKESDLTAVAESMYGYGPLLNSKARDHPVLEDEDTLNMPGLDVHARVPNYHGFGIVEEKYGDELRHGDLSEQMIKSMGVVERDRNIMEKFADQVDAMRQYPGIPMRAVNNNDIAIKALNIPATATVSALKPFGSAGGAGIPQPGFQLDEFYKETLKNFDGPDASTPVRKLNA